MQCTGPYEAPAHLELVAERGVDALLPALRVVPHDSLPAGRGRVYGAVFLSIQRRGNIFWQPVGGGTAPPASGARAVSRSLAPVAQPLQGPRQQLRGGVREAVADPQLQRRAGALF